MSDAQLMHAEKMARGEETYQGKLLEARQNDYKDEFVLVIISAPYRGVNVGSDVGRSDCDGEGKAILRVFSRASKMVHEFMGACSCKSIFGIKGTQIFRGGKK